MNRPPTTPDFDLSGNSAWRVLKHWALFKLLPFGGLAGGPGLKPLCIIHLTHRLGTPMAWALLLGEDRLRRLHRRILGRWAR